jgi:hypothetical protein
MKRTASRYNPKLIRAGLVLFIVLLAIYIPLKIHIVHSGSVDTAVLEGDSLSIFVTNELNGYREPCG